MNSNRIISQLMSDRNDYRHEEASVDMSSSFDDLGQYDHDFDSELKKGLTMQIKDKKS